jgi:hypothetical protein
MTVTTRDLLDLARRAGVSKVETYEDQLKNPNTEAYRQAMAKLSIEAAQLKSKEAAELQVAIRLSLAAAADDAAREAASAAPTTQQQATTGVVRQVEQQATQQQVQTQLSTGLSTGRTTGPASLDDLGRTPIDAKDILMAKFLAAKERVRELKKAGVSGPKLDAAKAALKKLKVELADEGLHEMKTFHRHPARMDEHYGTAHSASAAAAAAASASAAPAAASTGPDTSVRPVV